MASQKIGALWARKSKEGVTFLSGVLNDLGGDIQIAVFKNDRKEKDNQPDYNIVRSEPREQVKKENGDGFFPSEAPAGTVTEGSEEIHVENIPF